MVADLTARVESAEQSNTDLGAEKQEFSEKISNLEAEMATKDTQLKNFEDQIVCLNENVEVAKNDTTSWIQKFEGASKEV